MATTLYDLVSIKLQLGDETRRCKLPLKDLTPSTLPTKLCEFLNIPASKSVVFERYSDSAGAYITLDPTNLAVYKQLYRAAKAKAKLRIKVVVTDKEENNKSVPQHITEKDTPLVKIPSAMSSKTTISIPVRTFKAPEKVAEVKNDITTASSVVAPLKSWTGHLTSFTVQCNNCADNIPGVHYHCDICESNDFDLCTKCVEGGVHCDVDAHYLIKRSVVDGKIVNSTTYKVAKKPFTEPAEMPGAFRSEITIPIMHSSATRTCNSCITSYLENKFITCIDCEDYDLCQKCFSSDKHGHHPAHTFKPVDSKTILPVAVQSRLTVGRGLRHFATCDGCDRNIHGVRHKCLDCPDWDYCSTCILSARHIHQGHRFAPIYDHIGVSDATKAHHNFIRCDGPLCKDKRSYIRGDRYKCAVCPDTDFCANCEAIPTNTHCRTHPVIKLRTPVRNVSVTTFGEDGNGAIMSTMGDRIPEKISKSTETTSSKSTNAATQVQTIAEIKPASPKVDPVVETVEEKKVIVPTSPSTPVLLTPVSPTQASPIQLNLQAHYVGDTLVDGTKVLPDQIYTQTWTLRNPGAATWPAGCTVRYTGGDNMLNISTERPASTKDIESAVSSNTCPTEQVEGSEARFSVTIRTPKTPGRAVSYWRLKTPNGTPFGHKLWIDLNVVAEEPKPEVKETKTQSLESSLMVFPKLDKESPASSVLASQPSNVPSTTHEDVEFGDELEQLSLSDADSDDAFLTDEEYEMLDTDSAFEEAVNGKK